MTTEEIVTLATKAGFEVIAEHKTGDFDFVCSTRDVVAFFNLVAAKAAKKD